jgi:hypothetical protein
MRTITKAYNILSVRCDMEATYSIAAVKCTCAGDTIS